jgi:diguanylate cyclase (GGDEF)-like protein
MVHLARVKPDHQGMTTVRGGFRPLRAVGFRFALASLLPVLALGWFVNSAVRDTIETRTADVYGGLTSAMFRMASDFIVQPDDFERGGPLPPDQAAVIDLLIAEVGADNDDVRVQIVTRDRRVIYGNRPEDVGDRVEASEPLAEALAGETGTRFLRGRTPDGSRTADLVEISMPIEYDGDPRVYGAIIASGIDGSIVRSIDRDVRRMQTSLGVGLAALWLLLLPISSSVSRSLRRQAAANEHLARHDSLTGLPNRNLLDERLAEAMAATGSRQETSVGLLLVDLDRFKDVNDTLGHRAGDRLLAHIAEQLTGVVRPQDTVARLGGDEFAVVLPGLGSAAQLRPVAERIVAAIRCPIVLDGIEVAVDASIGGAAFPDAAADPVQLLQYADIAMYEAKAADEPFAMFRPGGDRHSPDRLALVADLGRAIDVDDQLVLHYQPVAAPSSGRVVTMEALVRWQHPRLGLLQPSAFIPMAEQSGLIRRLSAKVIDLALAQEAAWLREGLDVSMAVNLSAADLRSATVAHDVHAALRRHAVPAHRLELEVTETALLARPDTAAALVAAMRDHGIRVALDDFGTGHSSLTYLQRLRPDRLKIDRSFVGAMTHATTEAAIVRSLIELAHSLAIGVTAEGVETAEHWALLEELGCDLVQGYHLARPLPADEASAWIRRNHTSGSAGGRASVAVGATG